MAGPGGGPSRRSHTKSRKGCKTCKRRHIRCDETFPQCRNCTKHQVRCDYMDSPSAAAEESPRVPQTANLLWTPEIEKSVEIWRHTGECPFPDLNIYPQAHWHLFSKTDLRLVYHLASICSDVQHTRTSKLTLWTDRLPKFLSTAASHPFVMHAILSFSAAHLAWVAQSSVTRNLAFNHAAVALKGLHEAIGTFSKGNSDAVLAASILLSWQSTDWRGWASLMMGLNTITSAMQPWKDESLYADYILEHSYAPFQAFNSPGFQLTPEARREHLTILQNVQASLERILPYLASYDQESRWIEQLKGYIERVQCSNAAQTPEEQFGQLYALRKWLFWVPVSLLSSRKGDIYVLLVLAHFYATALALEPIFGTIGTNFCANMALSPLDEIIRIVNTVQQTQSYSINTQTTALMVEFPRETANNFRARREWKRQQVEMQAIAQSPYGLDTLNLDLNNHIAEYGYTQSLSPAFAPSPLHLNSPTNILHSSDPRSPYLEVPGSAIESQFASGGGGGSVYSTPITSPLGSPAAPPPGFGSHEESVFGTYGMSMYPSTSGFVAPTTIWT
ncbi:hypothetical protein K402DRAFT_331637 [Aulographum hederae CBS 113979]|uniref:Zn(2)-C6 fungal-type domain-containing protein n=1 Tax=Aulographum hederae CBS 113979 TaxID=1176131 RepID=A0A6G1H1D7_9PEZI|nr:hypothetical protein K402DRAFT_331637 [Aulographum hederae CBS 113979]